MSDDPDSQPVAQAIVDSIRTSLLVLDENLNIVSANRSYCETFKLDRREIEGRRFYELGAGEWDIPDLRKRLVSALGQRAWDGYEVEAEFAGLGLRTMNLDARSMASGGDTPTRILLAITDVTEMRKSEHAIKDLLQRKDILLDEMSHRIANSLSIIASILMMKARRTEHDETRHSLHETYHRVLSVAAVQRQLRMAEIDVVQIDRYLSDLCEQITASMIDASSRISLKVRVGLGAVNSDHAVHIGLIVTELVINALKYAFPVATDGGEVVVAYETVAGGWALTVSDNGIGGTVGVKPGLGTAIVDVLARQLEARVEVSVSAGRGRSISITHAARAKPKLLSADKSDPHPGSLSLATFGR